MFSSRAVLTSDRYNNERSAEGRPQQSRPCVRLRRTVSRTASTIRRGRWPFLGEWLILRPPTSLAELMRESDLDSCKIEVLRKAGIFDLNLARSEVIKQFANELLAKLPRI